MNSATCCKGTLWRNIGGELRRNMWVTALSALSFLLVLPVRAILVYQNWQIRYTAYELLRLADEIKDFCTLSHDPFITVVMVGASVVVALVFFRYLMMKRQVNFYHSQPRTRVQLLGEHFIAGWLVVAVPYLVNIVLAALGLSAIGLGEYLCWDVLLRSAALSLFYFTVMYATMVLGAMLAGTTLLQLLLGVFMQFVFPLLIVVYSFMRELLQPAWYSNCSVLTRAVLSSSPTMKYISLLGANTAGLRSLLYAALWLAACLVLSLLLYRRRPLEKTGSSLVFPRARVLFKYPLLIIVSSLSAWLLHEIGDYNRGMLWFYIGIILGGVIVAQIVEILFVSDFRGIKRKWWAALIAVALLCGTSALLDTDVFGYNTYIPPADEVVGVDIEVGAFDCYYSSWYSSYESNRDADSLDSLHSEDAKAIAAVLSMTEKLIGEGTEKGAYYYTEEPIDAAAAVEYSTEYMKKGLIDSLTHDDRTTDITVRWYLSNGRVQTRCYNYVIGLDAVREELAVLYDADDYRSNMYPVLEADPQLCCIYSVESHINGRYEHSADRYVNLNDLESALPEVYREELFTLTAAQMAQQLPVGRFDIAVLEKSPAASDTTASSLHDLGIGFRVIQCMVYPSMTKTMAELEKLGYGSEYWQVEYDKVINLSCGLSDDELSGHHLEQKAADLLSDLGLLPELWSISVWDSDQAYLTAETKDKEQIRQALELMVPQYAVENDPFFDYDEGLSFELESGTGDNYQYSNFTSYLLCDGAWGDIQAVR